jgi:hypothetical protein
MRRGQPPKNSKARWWHAINSGRRILVVNST